MNRFLKRELSPEDNALIDNTVSVDKAGWVSKVERKILLVLLFELMRL